MSESGREPCSGLFRRVGVDGQTGPGSFVWRRKLLFGKLLFGKLLYGKLSRLVFKLNMLKIKNYNNFNRKSWAARMFVALSLVACGLLWPQPVAAVDKYVTTPSGERVQLHHVMHPGGVVVEYWLYVDGNGKEVLHGKWIRSYRNGVKRQRITYAHGKKHGVFVKWQDNGFKEVEGQYVRGKLHGPIVWFYPSGNKRNEEVYRDGDLNGRFTVYYDTGQIWQAGTHLDGQRFGPYTEFHENGQPYIEATYLAGMFDGEIAIHDEAGSLRAKGKVLRDRVAGIWLCYPRDGGAVQSRQDCVGKIYIVCTCD